MKTLLVILCAMLAYASQGRCAATQVTLSELDDEDQYYVQGSFETPSRPQAVFAVLSDYDNLAGVLSGLRSSKVLSREKGVLMVEQILQGKFLFFSKALRLVLRIEEQAPWRIEFTQGEEKPFRHYQGSWVVEATSQGTRVDYTLTVSRGDMAPLFIERKLFRQNANILLDELHKEVDRRAALTTAQSPQLSRKPL